ncbi:GNAT family N-acetyltransferase [Flagellimonas meridianipacifica]|uniref:Acetyltransferase (GNAT) family protein n=1 Tax=Flagellimonas meridianipacifica TaxID=1080225 RepID=A0A2T0MGB8_9FLAO|nr:GNAT family N-acetyltransferase [Allomuricauda pacifica]PRX56628.1 acetyltransferase (GNAT) family protein [Allomuricauda pacifica]
MIVYKQASTPRELEQILTLQQQNLPKSLSQNDMVKDGFLTVEHSLELLKEMNDMSQHIIAVENEKVVGYALSMHPKFAESIDILKPMFHEINKVVKKRTNYMVMGQICIAKTHRGQGLFRKLYSNMKTHLPDGFDTIITEVDTKNQRSMNAHRAVGFVELKNYSSDGKDWSLIIMQ